MTTITPTGRRGSSARMAKGAQSLRHPVIGMLFVLPAAALIGVVFVVPLGLAVVMSLFEWPLLGRREYIGLGNYAALFSDGTFGRSLLFTAGFAVIVVPLTLLVGLALALMVQRRRRGIGLIRTAIFAPVAIGFASASYIFLALTNSSTGVFGRFLTDLHFTDRPLNWLLSPATAMALVILVTLWKTLGFAMVALMTGLQAIAPEIEDAARVDGAGWLRTLLFVRLPLMKNSIAFATTFTAIGTFLAFDQLFVLTGGGPNNSTITSVFKIYNSAFVQRDLGYAAAMSLVFLAFLLLVTGAQLRLLRRREP